MIKKILFKLTGLNPDNKTTEQLIQEYTERISQLKVTAGEKSSNGNIRNLAELDQKIQLLYKQRDALSSK